MICNWYLQTLASQTGGSCKQVVADAKGQGSIRRNNFTVFVYFQTVLLFENFFLNLVPNYVSGKHVFCIFVPDCSVPGCASRKFLQHFASPSLKFQGFSFTFNSDCILKNSFSIQSQILFLDNLFFAFPSRSVPSRALLLEFSFSISFPPSLKFQSFSFTFNPVCYSKLFKPGRHNNLATCIWNRDSMPSVSVLVSHYFLFIEIVIKSWGSEFLGNAFLKTESGTAWCI